MNYLTKEEEKRRRKNSVLERERRMYDHRYANDPNVKYERKKYDDERLNPRNKDPFL